MKALDHLQRNKDQSTYRLLFHNNMFRRKCSQTKEGGGRGEVYFYTEFWIFWICSPWLLFFSLVFKSLWPPVRKRKKRRRWRRKRISDTYKLLYMQRQQNCILKQFISDMLWKHCTCNKLFLKSFSEKLSTISQWPNISENTKWSVS